jgi:hypothetical protein
MPLSWVCEAQCRILGAVRVAIIIAVVIAATASVASAARALTPRALFDALRATSIANELPPGFSAGVTRAAPPSAHGRLYHMLGEIHVSVVGPHRRVGEVGFFVYPTAADARGEFMHPVRKKYIGVLGRVPGMRLPSELLYADIPVKGPGTTVTFEHATFMLVLSGNVIVASYIQLRGPGLPTVETTAAAHALLEAGLAHLNAVRKG